MCIIKGLEGSILMFSAIATAIFTGLLYKVAKDNLEKLNETSKKENSVNETSFMNEFSSRFFSPKTRLLFELIEYDKYEYSDNPVFVYKKDGEFDYFEIMIDGIDSEPIKQNYKESLKSEYGYEKKIFTTTEVDDLLLGHFEDMGTYRDENLLNEGAIYDVFDYYIRTCHENDQLKEYIKSARQEDNEIERKNNPDYNSDLYEKFDEINKFCKEEKDRRQTINKAF